MVYVRPSSRFQYLANTTHGTWAPCVGVCPTLCQVLVGRVPRVHCVRRCQCLMHAGVPAHAPFSHSCASRLRPVVNDTTEGARLARHPSALGCCGVNPRFPLRLWGVGTLGTRPPPVTSRSLPCSASGSVPSPFSSGSVPSPYSSGSVLCPFSSGSVPSPFSSGSVPCPLPPFFLILPWGVATLQISPLGDGYTPLDVRAPLTTVSDLFMAITGSWAPLGVPRWRRQ